MGKCSRKIEQRKRQTEVSLEKQSYIHLHDCMHRMTRAGGSMSFPFADKAQICQAIASSYEPKYVFQRRFQRNLSSGQKGIESLRRLRGVPWTDLHAPISQEQGTWHYGSIELQSFRVANSCPSLTMTSGK